jgi:hypothetical protein
MGSYSDRFQEIVDSYLTGMMLQLLYLTFDNVLPLLSLQTMKVTCWCRITHLYYVNHLPACQTTSVWLVTHFHVIVTVSSSRGNVNLGCVIVCVCVFCLPWQLWPSNLFSTVISLCLVCSVFFRFFSSVVQLKLLLHRIATFCLDFRHMGCLPDK